MSHRIIIFQPVDLDFWNDETAQVHHADESWKCSILQTWIIDMKQKSMYPSSTMDIDVILNDIMTIQKTEVWHMHGWHWQLQFLDIIALYWPQQHFLFFSPWHVHSHGLVTGLCFFGKPRLEVSTRQWAAIFKGRLRLVSGRV